MQITSGIISAARDGDETAQAAIVTHFMPKIRFFASVHVPGVEKEDLQQEGLVALFRAIDRWDSAGTASFETYAVCCIRNGIRDACDRALRKKHLPLNTAVETPEDICSPGPEEQALHAERYRAVVRTLHTRLTPLEKRVLVAHLNGLHHGEIAQRLGINCKSVENALGRVRAKLKNDRDLE